MPSFLAKPYFCVHIEFVFAHRSALNVPKLTDKKKKGGFHAFVPFEAIKD